MNQWFSYIIENLEIIFSIFLNFVNFHCKKQII